MVPLNFNQLYYFYRIAKLGSMTKASRTELVSTSALSMQLKELEQTLGMSLFSRVGNKLILTSEGAMVYEYAQDIFKLGFELKDTIGDQKNKLRQRLEIGSQDNISKYKVNELIGQVLKNDGSYVYVKEGNSDQLLRLLYQFKLDILFLNSKPGRDLQGVSQTVLIHREPLIMCAHSKWIKKIKLNSSVFQCCKNLPFILPTFESANREKIESFFHGKKIKLDTVAEVQDRDMEISLCLEGHGAILVPKSEVSSYLKEKRLVQIGKLPLEEELWLVVGKRKIINPLAEKLLASYMS